MCCRWSQMTGREKCRCVTVVLVYLLAVAGTVAMIYGGVQLFRVSTAGLAEDGQEVSSILDVYAKCSEWQAPAGAYNMETINHAIRFRCLARQLPTTILLGFAGSFMILALLCVPCAFKKDKTFGFTLWSTLAIATIIVGAVVVSVSALPAAAAMAPDCTKFDANTVQELHQMGVVCLKEQGMADKKTALKWFCKLHTFYAGSAVCLVSLMLLFMCKHCCCCNANACSSSAAASSGCGSGSGDNCPIRRAVTSFKARFCRRSCARSDANDSSLPVSAPTYYQVSEREREPSQHSEGASEDAGVGASSSSYYGVN